MPAHLVVMSQCESNLSQVFLARRQVRALPALRQSDEEDQRREHDHDKYDHGFRQREPAACHAAPQSVASINASPVPTFPAESVARIIKRWMPGFRSGMDRVIFS